MTVDAAKCILSLKVLLDDIIVIACWNPKSVDHLPREVIRLTKFILDICAEVEATLMSKHYRSLKIPCKVKAAMPETLLNKKFFEPEESAIMGSFVFDDIVMGEEPGCNDTKQPKSKKKKKRKGRIT